VRFSCAASVNELIDFNPVDETDKLPKENVQQQICSEHFSKTRKEQLAKIQGVSLQGETKKLP
jgi:hypothetical protein